MKVKEYFVWVIYLLSFPLTKLNPNWWVGLFWPGGWWHLSSSLTPSLCCQVSFVISAEEKKSDWFSDYTKKIWLSWPRLEQWGLLLPSQRAHLGQGFFGPFGKETSLSELPARVSQDPKVKALRENEGEWAGLRSSSEALSYWLCVGKFQEKGY